MAWNRTRLLRAARARLDLPPRSLWPSALPGAPAASEWRWQRRIARAPVLTGEQHAAVVGLKEIEEVIGCSLCGEATMQALFEARHPEGKWTYHVVRCPACGLVYRHPGIRPERLGDLYSGRYAKFLTGKYGTKRTRRYRLMMDAFSPLFADGTGRRLLDFGCGAGLFLEEAGRRGFEGWGVDLSEDAVAEARTQPSGQRVYFGAPTDVPEIAAGGFDVVTMWSVLAHLATPVEDLTMLRSLLAPDGVLLLLTVNANSLELKARGPHWNGFTKNHLKFFSPTTLRALFGLAGFEAMVTRPTVGDPIEAGTSKLSERNQRRVRAATHDGNRGNMLRAVAFAHAATPARWGLTDAVRL